MTALLWDQVGERRYETGVDRGVLGLPDGSAIAWTGLLGVEDSLNSELKSTYLDGVKISENLSPGDFVGKLKAYTYPDEFEQFDGKSSSNGLIFYEQPRKKFNLSYRTKIGSDEDADLGYRIHFLYNLLTNPDSKAYSTETDSSVEPIEFSWSLTGTPVAITALRPMVHIEVDSTRVDPDVLISIENLLYGTDEADPAFPTASELVALFA